MRTINFVRSRATGAAARVNQLLPRLGAGEPFGVLVARASEVGNSLATEKGEVTLHAGGHCAAREIGPRLAFGLAVENRSAQRFTIELRRDRQ